MPFCPFWGPEWRPKRSQTQSKSMKTWRRAAFLSLPDDHAGDDTGDNDEDGCISKINKIHLVLLAFLDSRPFEDKVLLGSHLRAKMASSQSCQFKSSKNLSKNEVRRGGHLGMGFCSILMALGSALGPFWAPIGPKNPPVRA